CLLLERWAQLLLWDVDLHAGALLLQGERYAKIALGPAALHGTRQLIERELPELHRHANFARQLERQRRVLVREPQREVRGVVFSRQEILGQAVEGPFAAARALAQGTEKSERFDAAFHAEREHFGERGMQREARGVVRELGDGAGADRADIERLVADLAQHRNVAIVESAIAAHPDRELAALRAARTATDRRVEEVHLLRRERSVQRSYARRRVGRELEPCGARPER